MNPEAAAHTLVGLLAHARSLLARRGDGEYREDEWGFDEGYAEAVHPLFEFLYEHWWRVRISGVENVPSHGRALLVANRAGSIFPFDGTMIGTGILKEHPLPRRPRMLVEEGVFELPFFGLFVRKVGGVPANPANAERLLEQEHLVTLFPEGAKGIEKPYTKRYRLEQFEGEFVETALRTGAPLVPVAVVGAEEIYPRLARSRLLARLVGSPDFPLTPTFPWFGPLGLIPLPARWRIVICRPVDLSEYGPEDAGDTALVFDIAERVRRTIQEAIYEGLVERGSAFL